MKPCQYEIRVQGDSADALLAALPQFTKVTASATPTTALRGVVRDQAELHGVLHILEQLGLELIEVRTTEST